VELKYTLNICGNPLENGNLEEHEGDGMILRLIFGKYIMRMG
jgi:hypothetical protein